MFSLGRDYFYSIDNISTNYNLRPLSSHKIYEIISSCKFDTDKKKKKKKLNKKLLISYIILNRSIATLSGKFLN